MTSIFIIKFGRNRKKTVVKVVIRKFATIGSDVSENEKKNRKNEKTKTWGNKRNSLGIWWTGSFPQNLDWI